MTTVTKPKRTRVKRPTRIDGRSVLGRRCAELRRAYLSAIPESEHTLYRLEQVRQAAELTALSEGMEHGLVRPEMVGDRRLQAIATLVRTAREAVAQLGLQADKEKAMTLQEYLSSKKPST
jgi:hypothetical protein